MFFWIKTKGLRTMKHVGIIGIVLILTLIFVPVVTAQSPPKTIYECENGGTKVCGTWTLEDDGIHYDATWDNGATGTLTILTWGPDSVTLSRLDSDGEFRGSYTGVLDNPNDRITNGQVTWSSNGQVWRGKWSANFS